MSRLKVKTRYTDDLPEGVNARNWPGRIHMRRGLTHSAAIWAQEAYEADWKRSWLNRIAFLFSESVRRDLELVGHEVEVQSAVRFYGADETAYRRNEAAALMLYDEFKDINEDDAYVFMVAQRDYAREWVGKHAAEIEAHK